MPDGYNLTSQRSDLADRLGARPLSRDDIVEHLTQWEPTALPVRVVDGAWSEWVVESAEPLSPETQIVLLEQLALGMHMRFARPSAAKRFDRIVSLGSWCQAAYQIRRVTGQSLPLFFDWIGSPFPALIRLLEDGPGGMFELENLEVVNGEVVDRATGFSFDHVFGRQPEGNLTMEDLRRNYAAGRASVLMLLRMFDEIVGDGSERVLLVRHEGLWAEHATQLWNALRQRYPEGDFELLVIGGADYTMQPENPHIHARSVRQPEPMVWTGDDAAWDQVLRPFWAQGRG